MDWWEILISETEKRGVLKEENNMRCFFSPLSNNAIILWAKYLSIYVFRCVWVYRDTCVHIFIHTHARASTHTYLCVYINAHTHTYTYNIYICYYCQREYSFIFYIAEELFIKSILHLTHYFPKILEHKHCIFFNEDSKDLQLPWKASFHRLFYHDRLKSCRYRDMPDP